MGRFQHIDHTADLALRVEGASLADLFITAAQGWLTLSISPVKMEKTDKIFFASEAESAEELLINFLGELNFLLIVKKWVFQSVKKISIKQQGNLFRLESEISGSTVDGKNLSFINEIKAVTYHNLNIEFTNNSFKVTVVFDI